MSRTVRGARASDNFAQIRNGALADARLSYRSRGILAYLLSLPIGWSTSSDKVAQGGTEGRDAVRTALRELEKFGYLVREQDRDAHGRRGEATYHVYDEPVDKSGDGFPGDGAVEPTVDGKPGDGSPVDGFSGHLRKKESKKENYTKTRGAGQIVDSPSVPGGGSGTSPAAVDNFSPSRPLPRPDHCVDHQHDPNPPPCPACAEARRTMQYVREQMLAKPCATHGYVGQCPFCPGGRLHQIEEAS